jgi:hypothetical protein
MCAIRCDQESVFRVGHFLQLLITFHHRTLIISRDNAAKAIPNQGLRKVGMGCELRKNHMTTALTFFLASRCIWGASTNISIIIALRVSNEGRETWVDGTGVWPLVFLTVECLSEWRKTGQRRCLHARM